MTRKDAKDRAWNKDYKYPIFNTNIIDEIYDYFESRTCESCKLYREVDCPVHSRDADDSFYCNKWEAKDDSI